MTKFKVGDNVRIVGNATDHCYPIGHAGLVTNINRYGMQVGPDTIGNWVLFNDAELVTDEDSGYNDGNWHGWDGGECPVHPETLIELVNPHLYHERDRRAGDTYWGYPLLFRVTKANRDPREAYFAQPSAGAWLEVMPDHPKAVLFREVLE